MSVQSVEALLDPATDADLRGHWDLLHAADLPSQARHTGATNAPHLTITVAGTIAGPVDAALTGLGAGLPLPIRWGGLLVFPGRRGRGGRGGSVLAWAVVVDQALLDLQEAYARQLGDGVLPTGAAGSWSPHVTLARGLTPEASPDPT